MPRGDRTGPAGMGPMTGRGAGPCAGYDVPGYATPGPRRGLGWRGFGRGFGRRTRFYAGGYGPDWDAIPVPPRPSREQEASWLKTRATDLQEALKQINERLNSLEQE